MNSQWHLQQVLTAWIVDGARDDLVTVLVPVRRPFGGRGERLERWPVDAVLRRLWGDGTPLPDEAAARLGVPPTTTYADIVHRLWPRVVGEPRTPLEGVPASTRAVTREATSSAHG